MKTNSPNKPSSEQRDNQGSETDAPRVHDPDMGSPSSEPRSISKAVEVVFEAWDLRPEQELDVHTTFTYFAAERFARPYEEGAHLAKKRAFGPEVRALIANGGLTTETIESYDSFTCRGAGFLELYDRLGNIKANWAYADALNSETGSFSVEAHETRVEPLFGRVLLPYAVEALMPFFPGQNGQDFRPRKPRKGDWDGTPGPGSKFLSLCLMSIGWDFTPEFLSNHWMGMLDRV